MHDILERLTALAYRAGRLEMASRRRGVAEIEAEEAGIMAEAPGPVEPLHELLAEVRALGAMISVALGAPVAGDGGRGGVAWRARWCCRWWHFWNGCRRRCALPGCALTPGPY